MNRFKNFLANNKLHVIYIAVIVVILFAVYLFVSNKTAHNTVPKISTIENTDSNSIAKGQLEIGKYSGKDNAKEVSDLINKAVKKQANATYFTNTQQEADSKAQALAKEDKADYLLKQTTKSADNKTADSNSNKQIQNNYYAISEEKKHSISVGATAVNGQTYATVAYTNDRLTYELHSKDLKKIDGASVMYTVKKW